MFGVQPYQRRSCCLKAIVIVIQQGAIEIGKYQQGSFLLRGWLQVDANGFDLMLIADAEIEISYPWHILQQAAGDPLIVHDEAPQCIVTLQGSLVFAWVFAGVFAEMTACVVRIPKFLFLQGALFKDHFHIGNGQKDLQINFLKQRRVVTREPIIDVVTPDSIWVLARLQRIDWL